MDREKRTVTIPLPPPIHHHPFIPIAPTPPPFVPPHTGLVEHCEATSIQSRSSHTHTAFSVPSLTRSFGCLSQQSEGRLCIAEHFGGSPFTTRQHRASDQQYPRTRKCTKVECVGEKKPHIEGNKQTGSSIARKYAKV